MGKDRQPFIGIFGRRNNGKSTLINRLAGQEIAIVSDIPGTTTDPVKKSFEITGFGPVVLVDTAGTDDIGELGAKRISKSLQAIDRIDLAILITTNNLLGEPEEKLISEFRKRDVPFLVIHNKEDLVPANQNIEKEYLNAGSSGFFKLEPALSTEPIIDAIRQTIPESAYTTPTLLGDLITPGDIVLLITPIDIEAPAGRMILPQVQTIRDVLDNDATCIVLKETEAEAFLKKTGIKPALVVTDSQVFAKADKITPKNIRLTSFSILLARLKGDFSQYMKGTPKIDELKDNDRVLILESCTHHVACDDIGREKIPNWLKKHTRKQLCFDVIAGLDNIKRPITDYALIIQCGGCMITRKQLHNRLKPAIDAGIPVTNYGMAIAWVHGIYSRAIAPFQRKPK